MNRRTPFSIVRFFSLALLLVSLILAAVQLVRFSRVRSYMPAGLYVAGVPVGGLDRNQATQRLAEVYSIPVELRYDGAAIRLDPNAIDFHLQSDNMLAMASLERSQKQFW